MTLLFTVHSPSLARNSSDVEVLQPLNEGNWYYSNTAENHTFFNTLLVLVNVKV